MEFSLLYYLRVLYLKCKYTVANLISTINTRAHEVYCLALYCVLLTFGYVKG